MTARGDVPGFGHLRLEGRDIAGVGLILFPEMQKRGMLPGELSSLLATSSAMSKTIPRAWSHHGRLGRAGAVDRGAVHRRPLACPCWLRSRW